MVGEIVYADLTHPGHGSSPAEKCRAPALCPRWHGVVLKASGLVHLILLVLVVMLSIQVFQKSLQPAAMSGPLQSVEIKGRNQTEQYVFSSLMQYFCKPRQESPSACAGCQLCPQDWQLHGERCYWLSKEQRNWKQSKKGCENQESQLVVLQDNKEKEYIKNITGRGTQPLWIGLILSHEKWRWVDNTTFDTNTFGTLQGMDGRCGTLKDAALEVDTCDGEHKWVCQKDPFQLSRRRRRREKCGASA